MSAHLTPSPHLPVAHRSSAATSSSMQTAGSVDDIAVHHEPAHANSRAVNASLATLGPVFDAMTGSRAVTVERPRCMARNLAVLAYAQGFSSFLYRDETASIADIETPGFFADVAGHVVKHGDALTIRCIEGVAHRWLDTRGGTVIARRCV